jgi:hypothetical protein
MRGKAGPKLVDAPRVNQYARSCEIFHGLINETSAGHPATFNHNPILKQRKMPVRDVAQPQKSRKRIRRITHRYGQSHD